MADPLVHVLVINWNGLEHLEACFSSLLESTYANARFVLLDNGSTDGSVEYVRDHFGHDARVEIVDCGGNLGWSGGNNVGLRRAQEAGADYVFLLNNDTWTAPDAIEKLVAMAEERPHVGALAPKMVLYDTPEVLNSLGLECSIIGCCWDLGLGRADSPQWDTPRQVIGVCGGAWLIRTTVLEQTGVLPKEFGIYSDDLDLSLRIWHAGYEIWNCPSAVVRHKFSATMGKGKNARRKYYLNTRNRFRVLQRQFPLAKALPIKLAVAQGEAKAIGRAVLEGRWWSVWAHIKAWGSCVPYLPKALAERRRRRALGQRGCPFWRFIQRRPLFFPGIEMPEEGWYAERSLRGELVKPIAHRAKGAFGPGTWRFVLINAYPELGEAAVSVSNGQDVLCTLTALDRDEATVELAEPSELTLDARGLFRAEETGEHIDIGGWLRIEQVIETEAE